MAGLVGAKGQSLVERSPQGPIYRPKPSTPEAPVQSRCHARCGLPVAALAAIASDQVSSAATFEGFSCQAVDEFVPLRLLLW